MVSFAGLATMSKVNPALRELLLSEALIVCGPKDQPGSTTSATSKVPARLALMALAGEDGLDCCAVNACNTVAESDRAGKLVMPLPYDQQRTAAGDHRVSMSRY